jgi:hypothetical protein
MSRAFLWHLKCGETFNVRDSTELLCFKYLGGRDLVREEKLLTVHVPARPIVVLCARDR